MISCIVNSIYRYAPLLWRSIRIQYFKQFSSRARKVKSWQMHFEWEFVHQTIKKASTGSIPFDELMKSNGRDAIYTVCIIGQCLTELKNIYRGNKKLLICATKDLFSISYVYFLLTCANSPQHIIGCRTSYYY